MYQITNIDKKLMLINIMYITTLLFYKIGMQNSIISKAQLKTVTIFLYIYGDTSQSSITLTTPFS